MVDYAAKTFAGCRFTRAHIYEALHITHTTISNDAALFKPEVMAVIPRIKAWYNDPDNLKYEKYSNMSVSQFRRYIEKALADRKQTAVSDRRGSSSKEKRKAVDTEDGRQSKRGRASSAELNMSSPEPEVTSDDLDGE